MDIDIMRKDILRETEKAILVDLFIYGADYPVWLPKKHVEIWFPYPEAPERGIIRVPYWLARKHRL